MATHKSAIKRSKQSEKNQLRNASMRSSIKTKIKTILKAVEGKDKAASEAALAVAIPSIAKAGAKGLIHKRNASRKISRLTRKVQAI